jgi:hypothetical protein
MQCDPEPAINRARIVEMVKTIKTAHPGIRGLDRHRQPLRRWKRLFLERAYRNFRSIWFVESQSAGKMVTWFMKFELAPTNRYYSDF